jgi:hypothetical protein
MSKTYGQANPTLSATVTGTVNNDVLTLLGDGSRPDHGVGSYRSW